MADNRLYVVYAPSTLPGKLVDATNATLPPVQFIDEKGNLQGMRIEMGNEIAKRLPRQEPESRSTMSENG